MFVYFKSVCCIDAPDNEMVAMNYQNFWLYRKNDIGFCFDNTALAARGALQESNVGFL